MHDPILQEPVTVADGVLLRPIRAQDEPAIARIIRAAMTEFGAVGRGTSFHDTEIDHMAAAYAGERRIYYVLDDGGRVAGGSGLGPLVGGGADVCELRKMYLMPAARNRGLGRALMDRCMDAARRFGYRKVYLETLDTMHQARAFYAKYGFAPVQAPMGATGHFGCDRWFLKVLDGGFPPLGEGERWVEL